MEISIYTQLVLDTITLDNLHWINDKWDSIERDLIKLDWNIKSMHSKFAMNEQKTQRLTNYFMRMRVVVVVEDT